MISFATSMTRRKGLRLCDSSARHLLTDAGGFGHLESFVDMSAVSIAVATSRALLSVSWSSVRNHFWMDSFLICAWIYHESCRLEVSHQKSSELSSFSAWQWIQPLSSPQLVHAYENKISRESTRVPAPNAETTRKTTVHRFCCLAKECTDCEASCTLDSFPNYG